MHLVDSDLVVGASYLVRISAKSLLIRSIAATLLIVVVLPALRKPTSWPSRQSATPSESRRARTMQTIVPSRKLCLSSWKKKSIGNLNGPMLLIAVYPGIQPRACMSIQSLATARRLQ